MATKEDIETLTRTFDEAWFCLCPNSNRYIENRLPDIEILQQQTQNITIGTDSLASNDTLSILEELKTIATRIPEIPTHTLLKWGTQNGARFMGIEANFGTLEVGKRPGLNHIACEGFDLGSAVKVTKIC